MTEEPVMNVAGRHVLVTGASSGIGSAMARRLSQAGAVVGLCARRTDRLEEVLTTCREHSPDSRLWTFDLSQLDELEGFAHRVLDEWGHVDVLVNNAGIPKRRLTTAMTAADVESVMALNYFSPARLAIALLPHFMRRGSGHIVNVSSMGVHSAAYRVSAYAASKAALELFTEGLYLELAGTGVRASLLVPGSTSTEFSTDKPDNDPPSQLDPSQVADPSEVAEALLACLSTSDFRTIVTARDAKTLAAKDADPNAFLARTAAYFSRAD